MPGYANPFMPGGPGNTRTQTGPGAPPPTIGLPPGPGNPSNSTTPPEWTEDYFLNQDPDAAFMAYLQSQGAYAPNTTQTKYAMGQQGRTYREYLAQAAKNPEQGFWDYLRQNKPDYSTEFQNQAPEQRGDYSSRILTPRARWVAG